MAWGHVKETSAEGRAVKARPLFLDNYFLDDYLMYAAGDQIWKGHLTGKPRVNIKYEA